MAKKIKVILKSNDQKALDDMQDFEKMTTEEQSIIENANLGRYKFFSYTPDLGRNKHVLEIIKRKNKISPRKVQELLSPLVKHKDSYISKAVEYLISLSPRCFYVEVSKKKGVASRDDSDCIKKHGEKKYALGISDFVGHHATKDKSPEDAPYDEENGLYKRVRSRHDYIYYYFGDEVNLRNKIMEILNEKALENNNPFYDFFK